MHRPLCCLLVTLCCAVPKPPVESGAVTAEQELTLPSGATLKVASDWSVTRHEDGLTLVGPDRALLVEVVEIDGSPDAAAAIAGAWKSRVPDFGREQLSASDSPGRDGWDALHGVIYKTSPEENRYVAASTARLGALTVVTLVDAPLDALQRRISQVRLLGGSLRPAGFEREMYSDKTPQPLDDAAVAELRTFIDNAMKLTGTPGVAVTLFDRERVILERGFGVRELGGEEPVTPETLFLIASNTKPLTTLLLARLVDQGRFTWKTPVVDVYPQFQLGDAETTKRVLVEHLVCACTGLPRQDFEWLFTYETSSPKDQLAVLATMQPTTEFGALYQYSNPLASAAGYIAAHTLAPGRELGEAYDEIMGTHVFAPLGMEATTFSFERALAGEHASPHALDDEMKPVIADFTLNRSVLPLRPAGGAWSSVRDYAKVLRMELAGGRLPDGSTFISEETLLARRAPQVRVGEESWYGMGLWLEDLKGVRVISHGGSLFGYKSDFFFVPELGLGAVVLTNSDRGYAITGAIKQRVMEMIYDGEPEAAEDLEAGVRSFTNYIEGERADWVVPPDAAAVARLADSYRSPALGGLSIEKHGDQVRFVFDGWQSPMATKVNPDGTVSFMSTNPVIWGLELNAPAAGAISTLTLRDPQHVYPFEAVE